VSTALLDNGKVVEVAQDIELFEESSEDYFNAMVSDVEWEEQDVDSYSHLASNAPDLTGECFLV
jgi:ABC-type dipeptide/oligopeptide/nickel transport system ATPase component